MRVWGSEMLACTYGKVTFAFTDTSDRQTDRRTNGVTDKQTDRQTGGGAHWLTVKQVNSVTNRQTRKLTVGTERRTDERRDGRRQTDRQKDRWANRAWFLRTCLKSFRTLGKCLFLGNDNTITFENLVKYFFLARDSLTILKLANQTRLDYYLSVIKKLQL